jgi:hypothetical protein
MASREEHNEEPPVENWYKWGVFVLYLEMVIAILVSLYSLYMAFSGEVTALGH